MGYHWVSVRAWIDEGERPGQGLPPGSPVYPDQGLPVQPPYPGQGLPPGIWGGPGSLPGGGHYPDQGLPGGGHYPDQGLPGGGHYPDQGLPGGGGGERPDQGLPPGAGQLPQAFEVEEMPVDPPDDDGQYVLAVFNNEATWVWLPRQEDPEVEPPE